MAASMESLPAETLLAIAEDLSIKELRVLRAVSKKWNAIATPRVFRGLHVTSTRPSAEGFQSVLQVESLICHVREVCYQDRDADEYGRSISDARLFSSWNLSDRPILTALQMAFSLLAKSQQIRSLKLIFYPRLPNKPDSLEIKIQATILCAFFCAEPLSPSLKSLSIVNLLTCSAIRHHYPFFTSIPRSLTTLHVSTLSDDPFQPNFPPDRSFHSQFWEVVVPHGVLHHLNSSSSLTSLCLHSDRNVGFLPSFTFTFLNFPRLARLSLKRIMFHEAIGTEEFIIRHKETIEFLELRHCMMAVIADTETPSRFWGQVWDRFSTELAKLRSIVVREEYDMKSHQDIKYAFFSLGDGFQPIHDLAPLDDGDEDALQALETRMKPSPSDIDHYLTECDSEAEDPY